MCILCTDDSILAGPDEEELNQIIKDLKRAKLNATEEGDIQDFLGTSIKNDKNGKIHMVQPHLIDQILKDLRLDEGKARTKETPALTSKTLARLASSDNHDGHFDC